MTEPERVPTAVWRVDAAVVAALDERLGPPVDGYVNGTQTWLTDDGPNDATLEWQLHPVAKFLAPAVRPEELFDAVVGALADGGDPDALAIGEERRALSTLWDGLECFPAYGGDMEPVTLARAATEALGIAPLAGGLVDHARIGEAWERAARSVSLTEMVLDELAGAA